MVLFSHNLVTMQTKMAALIHDVLAFSLDLKNRTWSCSNYAMAFFFDNNKKANFSSTGRQQHV